MSDRPRFLVGDLAGLGAPCDHLSAEEAEALAEGRLAAGRLGEIEAHAASCPACAELLDDLERFRTLASRGLTVPSERRAFDAADAAVRRKLRLSRAPQSAPRRILRAAVRYGWLPALAAAVLLLVWLRPPPPVLIASVEAVPLEPPPTVRGLSLGETWDRLERPWNAGAMAEAARILDTAAEEHPDRADLLFYLGVARLRSGEAASAVEALQKADRLEAEAPSENTRWMLAAALERTGRIEEACDALRSVAEIGGARAGAAREIVDRACREAAPPADQSLP